VILIKHDEEEEEAEEEGSIPFVLCAQQLAVIEGKLPG